MFCEYSPKEASPSNERRASLIFVSTRVSNSKSEYLKNLQITEVIALIFLTTIKEKFLNILELAWGHRYSTMAMKMKGIYKSFKSISQMFVVKERELEIGHPTEAKHVAHVGWEGSSSGSAPGWMSEFKVAAEVLSPRASSFSHARHPSFFTNSSYSGSDQGSSQLSIPDRPRDMPPTPKDVSKIHTKSKNRRKKQSSTTPSPRSKSSPKSFRSTGVSKPTYKAGTSRLNSNA